MSGPASSEARLFPGEDHVGWWNLPQAERSRFANVLGPLAILRETDRSARLRMMPEDQHANLEGSVHGGTILTLIDCGFYLIPRVLLGERLRGGLTLDLSNHFVAVGRVGVALDVVGEIIRETGRLIFMRGLVEQEGETLGSFSGTLRKVARGG